MSVEIDWEALTTGPDGHALAESIRDFIHAKFQDVKLPKFIRTVKVHSFEFGDECPQVVLKDICDPLDEFYESDEASSEEDGEGVDDEINSSPGPVPVGSGLNQQVPGLLDGIDDQRPHSTHSEQPLLARRGIGAPTLNGSALSALGRAPLQSSASAIIAPTPIASTSRQHPPGLRTLPSFVDQLASPLLHSRATTPGIPGGTANLSYFHHAPFPHHQPTFPAPWSDYNFTKPGAQRPGHTSPGPHVTPLTSLQQSHGIEQAEYSTGDPSTRPSTATTQAPLSRVPTGPQETQHDQQRQHKQRQHDMTPNTRRTGKNRRASKAHDFENLRSSPPFPSPSMSGRSQARPEPNPMDMQLVLHVRYSGGIRLALSAEILLDYPMSSFVSIPLQLTITGVSFDGVAIVAHVRPPLSTQSFQHQQASDSFQAGTDQADKSDGDNRGRAHICFLSPEDARALLGADARDLGSEEDGIDGGAEGGGSDFPPSSSPEAAESPEMEQRRSRGFGPASPTTASPGLSRASTLLNQQPGQRPGAQKRSGSEEEPALDEGLGGLLREIRVESEIGQRREGQHSLRNVGKVERFVLEQVRRIFEDEFVWPSFWTFLL